MDTWYDVISYFESDEFKVDDPNFHLIIWLVFISLWYHYSIIIELLNKVWQRCLFYTISDRNIGNRSKRESMHCTGSKSFAQISFENVRSNNNNTQNI